MMRAKPTGRSLGGAITRAAFGILMAWTMVFLTASCGPTPEETAQRKKAEERIAASQKEREQAEVTRKAAIPDAARRKKILSTLKANNDEFQKATFYQHPGTPVLGTPTYLYIAESRDHYTLRLVATYEGDNWIFWDKLLVKVGDQVVTLDAGRFNVKRHNAAGRVWETLDMPVASGTVGAEKLNFTEITAPIFASLMSANSASMRFRGESLHDRQIPKAEITRFKEVGKKYMGLFGIKD